MRQQHHRCPGRAARIDHGNDLPKWKHLVRFNHHQFVGIFLERFREGVVYVSPGSLPIVDLHRGPLLARTEQFYCGQVGARRGRRIDDNF